MPVTGLGDAEAGCATVGAGFTLTWSNVEVLSVLVLWLLTARPMSTVLPIAIVADPTCVQVTPSGES